MNRNARRRLRVALLVAVAALFVASVPWYRAADPDPARWLGLPDWVSVALACYAAAAVLNGWAWLLSDFEDEGDG